MDDIERARTLEAYRRAKWAELADEGPEGLRRELASLEAALADPDWGGGRVLDVDNAFRRAKVAVLRELLEAHSRQ